MGDQKLRFISILHNGYELKIMLDKIKIGWILFKSKIICDKRLESYDNVLRKDYIKSFSPKIAHCGCANSKRRLTTVTTPSKCPGRDVPS